MQLKTLSILIISFLFIGCSQKNNSYAKPTDILHEQSLTKTQKTVLKKELKTKIYFVTTYINDINHVLINKDENLEKFIVSVYVPNDEDKKRYDSLFFKLNGKVIKSSKELKNDNKLLSILPTANPWSRYYMVEAPVDERKKGLLFEVGVFGIGSTKMEFHDKYGNLPSGRTK